MKRDNSHTGLLSHMGVSRPQEIPFILPDGYHQITPRLSRIESIPLDEFCHIVVLLDGEPEWNPSQTRLTYWAELVADEPLKLVLSTKKHDIDKRSIKKYSGRCVVLGELKQQTRGLVFEIMAIRGRIGRDEIQVSPFYKPTDKQISHHYLDRRMFEEVDNHIDAAARLIKKQLGVTNSKEEQKVLSAIGAGEDWRINRLLRQVHNPSTPEAGEEARELLQHLSVYSAVIEARKSLPSPTPDAAFPACEQLDYLASHIPFPLTDEQMSAVRDIVASLRSDQPMRHILSGDVGTGKTVVFALVAASVVMAGGFVVILTPNTLLVQQTAANIRSWFPELVIGEVTGSTNHKLTTDTARDFDILIGTTALITRVGEIRPDLCIVDEQQKMSVSQREFHGSHNLLEATATCIPRSQALMEYGIYGFSRLRQAHVPKRIITKIKTRSERMTLLDTMNAVLERKGKVMIVYPRAEESENTELLSVVEAAESWSQRFPDRVAWVHGKASDAEKAEALQQMRDGEKEILVSTSVIEVGIDLPDVRLMVVVNAERFGAKELHQLRGRLARNGGTGLCALMVPDEIMKKPNTLARLQILADTTDGFEVAERNLMLQGFGDLRHKGEQQRGALDGFLPGFKITYERVKALELIEAR